MSAFNNGSTTVAMAHQDRAQRERIAELEPEVERLREVERAARAYFREFDHLIDGEYPERSDLRDALASTPGGQSNG